MLMHAQEKLIRSLHTKKGREKAGKCIVEGEKVVRTASDAVEFVFRQEDSAAFNELVTTETPQDVAAVARIPEWSDADIRSRKTIVVLDGVQDPGNVGAILRLCLGFAASLVLIDSVDVTNPKVVRSSVGALFHVPWRSITREDAVAYIQAFQGTIFRLEANDLAVCTVADLRKKNTQPVVLIAGSEGQGIQLPIVGESLSIGHEAQLESLNVSQALAIALHEMYCI
ncbi:MAG: RNA methyltransferase [Candidatus Kerfeldbacteria bacterium]|nr:RNA methyltransferase [Candidatus Kerfeldbacteria bacterium]